MTAAAEAAQTTAATGRSGDAGADDEEAGPVLSGADVEVPAAKIGTVEELARMVRDHPVVAVAGFRGLPAAQFQGMRQALRGQAELKVAKNNLLLLAMEEAAGDVEGLADLEAHIEDQTVVIASDLDPFKLFRAIQANKSKAPAKGGETAEEDIVVPKGETPFPPGPIVGDLQKAGIPAAIEGGKVVVKQDKVLVEEGDRIPRDVAQALTRLDIHPVTVGLEFRAALEDGTVFLRDVLDVDLEAFRADLQSAIARADNLAVELAYAAPRTVPLLLAKAQTGAVALAVEAGVLTAETAPLVLGRAQAGAQAIWAQLSPEAREGGGAAATEQEPAEEPEAEEPPEEPEAEPAEDEEGEAEQADEGAEEAEEREPAEEADAEPEAEAGPAEEADEAGEEAEGTDEPPADDAPAADDDGPAPEGEEE